MFREPEPIGGGNKDANSEEQQMTINAKARNDARIANHKVRDLQQEIKTLVAQLEETKKEKKTLEGRYKQLEKDRYLLSENLRQTTSNAKVEKDRLHAQNQELEDKNTMCEVQKETLDKSYEVSLFELHKSILASKQNLVSLRAEKKKLEDEKATCEEEKEYLCAEKKKLESSPKKSRKTKSPFAELDLSISTLNCPTKGGGAKRSSGQTKMPKRSSGQTKMQNMNAQTHPSETSSQSSDEETAVKSSIDVDVSIAQNVVKDLYEALSVREFQENILKQRIKEGHLTRQCGWYKPQRPNHREGILYKRKLPGTSDEQTLTISQHVRDFKAIEGSINKEDKIFLQYYLQVHLQTPYNFFNF